MVIGEDVLGLVDRSAGDPGGVEFIDRAGPGAGRQPAIDDRIQIVPIGGPRGAGLAARVVNQIGGGRSVRPAVAKSGHRGR